MVPTWEESDHDDPYRRLDRTLEAELYLTYDALDRASRQSGRSYCKEHGWRALDFGASDQEPLGRPYSRRTSDVDEWITHLRAERGIIPLPGIGQKDVRGGRPDFYHEEVRARDGVLVVKQEFIDLCVEAIQAHDAQRSRRSAGPTRR